METARTIPAAAYDKLYAFAMWQHQAPIDFNGRNLDDLTEVEDNLLGQFGLSDLCMLGIAGIDGTTLVAEDEDGQTIELVRGSL